MHKTQKSPVASCRGTSAGGAMASLADCSFSGYRSAVVRRGLALAALPALLSGCADRTSLTAPAPSLAIAPSPTGVVFVAPDGAGDGSSWATPAQLDDALANAPTGSELWLKKGTYVPDGTGLSEPRAATFAMRSGIAVYGGFTGTETSRDQRVVDPEKNGTVLSGDRLGNDNMTFNPSGIPVVTTEAYGDNVYRVVTSANTDASAVLDGISIEGGVANVFGGPSAPAAAGGLSVSESALTLSNVIIRRNVASVAAGMDLTGSLLPTLTNVVFRENLSTGDGGGLRVANFSSTSRSVIVERNAAYGSGGGMAVAKGASVDLRGWIFRDNLAFSSGGAIATQADFPQLNAAITLVDVVMTNNFAGSDRSAAAEGRGGAIYVRGTALSVTNAVLLANSAKLATIAADFSPGMAITNATFSGNRCSDGGCAIYSPNYVAVRNSILWDNGSRPIFVAIVNVANSIVQGGFTGSAILDADPQFVRAVPVPPVDGRMVDVGDVRLQRTSPAINAGSNDVVGPSFPVNDLDGKPRIQGGVVDMGAYEANQDFDAPTYAATLSGTRGTNDWYTSDVTVAWNWSDAGTGLDASSCPLTTTSLGESPSIRITATCSDKAGNTVTGLVQVKIDKTKPATTYRAQEPLANAAGWNNGPITLLWVCKDATSGVVSTSTTSTLSTAGVNVKGTGTCTDNAGNVSTAEQAGFNIDPTPPELKVTVSPNPVLMGLTATATFVASDALSGLAGPATCGPLSTATVGPKMVSCSATDKAGNTRGVPAEYTVISASTEISNLSATVTSLKLGTLQNPLLVKLASAQSKLAARNTLGAISDLNDFITQLIAQRGKGIKTADADALIARARLVIQSIQTGI